MAVSAGAMSIASSEMPGMLGGRILRHCGVELGKRDFMGTLDPRFMGTTSAAFLPASPTAIRLPTWSLNARTGSSARFT